VIATLLLLMEPLILIGLRYITVFEIEFGFSNVLLCSLWLRGGCEGSRVQRQGCRVCGGAEETMLLPVTTTKTTTWRSMMMMMRRKCFSSVASGGGWPGWMRIDNQLFSPSNLAAELGTKRYQGKGGQAVTSAVHTKRITKSSLCSTPAVTVRLSWALTLSTLHVPL
jgi:hypothetical protein